MSLVREIYDICAEKLPSYFIRNYLNKKMPILWNESNKQSTVSKSPLPMQNSAAINISLLPVQMFFQLFCLCYTIFPYNNLTNLILPLYPSTIWQVTKQSIPISLFLFLSLAFLSCQELSPLNCQNIFHIWSFNIFEFPSRS